jgi:hypothetical protein
MPTSPRTGQLGAGAKRVIVDLDANIVIYLVEHHPVWGTKAQARITQLRSAGEQTAISDAHATPCTWPPRSSTGARFLTNDVQLSRFPDITVEILT